MLTVRMVDSQEGQQVALQIHDKPRGIQFIRLKSCASSLKWRELLFGEARRIMPYDGVWISTKLG